MKTPVLYGVLYFFAIFFIVFGRKKIRFSFDSSESYSYTSILRKLGELFGDLLTLRVCKKMYCVNSDNLISDNFLNSFDLF